MNADFTNGPPVSIANERLSDQVNLESIAEDTAGFTGAELENILNEAAIVATKNKHEDIENDDIDLGHEAKIGRIPDEDIYYLMSRGLTEEDAKAMLVRGFAEPISKALPLEYAVEMNRLIDLEFEGAIG